MPDTKDKKTPEVEKKPGFLAKLKDAAEDLSLIHS